MPRRLSPLKVEASSEQRVRVLESLQASELPKALVRALPVPARQQEPSHAAPRTGGCLPSLRAHPGPCPVPVRDRRCALRPGGAQQEWSGGEAVLPRSRSRPLGQRPFHLCTSGPRPEAWQQPLQPPCPRVSQALLARCHWPAAREVWALLAQERQVRVPVWVRAPAPGPVPGQEQLPQVLARLPQEPGAQARQPNRRPRLWPVSRCPRARLRLLLL